MLCLWGFCLLLGACSQSPAEQRLDDYLQRSARALELDALEPVRIAVPESMPRRRKLQTEFAASSLSMLDYLSLAGCELQTVVAQANSQLGKTAQSSQRLLLDLRFLHYAPPCIEYLNSENKEKIAEQIVAAADLKRSQLRARIWQAIFGGVEYRAFWQAPEALGDYPVGGVASLLETLDWMHQHSTRWLAGEYQLGLDSLEQQLMRLRVAEGGLWIHALALNSSYLSSVDQLLQRRQEALTSFCPQRQANSKTRRLGNVVQKFFVAEVQPWSAEVNRRQLAVLAKVQALEALLAESEPADFRRWRLQRDQWLEYQRLASRRHVDALQALLSACQVSLTPG